MQYNATLYAMTLMQWHECNATHRIKCNAMNAIIEMNTINAMNAIQCDKYNVFKAMTQMYSECNDTNEFNAINATQWMKHYAMNPIMQRNESNLMSCEIW